MGCSAFSLHQSEVYCSKIMEKSESPQDAQARVSLKNTPTECSRIGHSESHSAIEILTRKELASHLKCSLRHVDNLQTQGMPVLRLGRSRRFILSDVIAWLRRRANR